MTGKHFIDEWGFTSSPIAFTDSMSIGAVYQALMTHAWSVSRELGESEEIGYAHLGWPVVGETWGGGVTDIHDGKSTLTYEQILEAINDAETRTEVAEGGQGGGAGMLCQGHKGGTGTSSRIVPGADGEEFVVGVLVQSNYGQKSTLQIGGVPIGKLLLKEEAEKTAKEEGATETVSERGKHETEGSKQYLTPERAPWKILISRRHHHSRHNRRTSPPTPTPPSSRARNIRPNSSRRYLRLTQHLRRHLHRALNIRRFPARSTNEARMAASRPGNE